MKITKGIKNTNEFQKHEYNYKRGYVDEKESSNPYSYIIKYNYNITIYK